MASLPIHWIAARTYCQATEEEDRVRQALDAVMPGGVDKSERIDGQFGNPVLVLERRIERPEDIRATWRRWRKADLLATLERDLDARLDGDGVLHLRVDKQSAVAGILAPARGADPVDLRVKLKAYPANPAELLKVARALLTEAV